MWGQDRDYSDLMRELWGSPDRWNARKTYAGVASRLGVDEETVRNRLKRLRESGFLLGWRMVPNPALFDRESVFMYLEFGDAASADAAIASLSESEGVVAVTRLLGNTILVMLFDDPSHAASGKIADLGAGEARLRTPGMQLPPTRFSMIPLDWRIISLMLGDAERRISEVASIVCVSQRTVKNRLNRMMDSAAIFIAPMVDVRKSVGVSYQLILECVEGTVPEVSRLVASRIENMVFRATDSGNGLIFGFNGRNLSEGSEIEKWLKQQPSVRFARINMVEQVFYPLKWLEEETARSSARP